MENSDDTAVVIAKKHVVAQEKTPHCHSSEGGNPVDCFPRTSRVVAQAEEDEDPRISGAITDVSRDPRKPAPEGCNSTEITPHSLISHLHATKEFELYYYLFNQVEIRAISNHTLEISRDGSDKVLNNRLIEILSEMTESKWSLALLDIDNPLSLKEKTKTSFAESKEWLLIKESFADSQIVDILLSQ
jgi:hypothetical protein